MEASLSDQGAWLLSSSPLPYTDTSSSHVMPCSLLVQDQGMEPPFMHISYATASSPSLDMEAALQQLSSSCEPLDMAFNSESSSSCEDPDVPMMDPFLDFINEVLMEEEMEGAACNPQDGDAPYWSILRGFYEIVDEQNQQIRNWATSSSSEDSSDSPLAHQIFSSYDSVPDEQHVKVSELNDGVISLTDKGLKLGVPRVYLPDNGNPYINFQQGKAEVGFVKPGLVQESYVVTNDTPLETSQISELHVVRSAIYTPCSGLNGSNITTAQGYHDAINLNNGGTTDLMVSSQGGDAVVEGLITHTSYSGKEQGNGHIKLPSENEEFAASKPIDIGVSFEDLKLNDDYTALYVGEPRNLGSSTTAARGSGVQNGDKKKALAAAGKGSKRSGNKGTAEVQAFVDPREVLVSCAQAVAKGDPRRANEILQELRQVHGASASGSSLQRTAHYFSKALVARMRGMGGQEFRAISESMPSTATRLRSIKLSFEVFPYMKITHYFANQSILNAAEGASRVHIVDYGLLYGIQWPCLINALADRKGGPPLLVITGIEFPQPGHNPAEKLEASGHRLAAYARTYNVPFQYHAIATSKWEELDATSLHLHEDEVLVVNCMKRFRHLADESVDMASTASPRQKLLTCMRSLNPHLFLFADVSAPINSAFFISRFREALYYYSNAFDMMDTLWGDSHERLMMEVCYHYHCILNIVACEGEERVERPETYKQWQVRINRAGFEQLPIPPTILSRSRSHLKQHYHKDFNVDDDANGWMLLGWKGRTTMALSAWRQSACRADAA